MNRILRQRESFKQRRLRIHAGDPVFFADPVDERRIQTAVIALQAEIAAVPEIGGVNAVFLLFRPDVLEAAVKAEVFNIPDEKQVEDFVPLQIIVQAAAVRFRAKVHF